MPDLYPIFTDLAGRGVLVVGGGTVAARKVRRLVQAGARVTVVAPELCAGLRETAADPHVDVMKREYRSADIEGKWLVVAATDDEELNRRVSAEAAAARIFCNVVDQPELCTFQVPARVRRGLLQIAISTGGASPALAKRMRKRLEREYGPAHADLLEALLELREHFKSKYPDDQGRRRHLLESFIDSPVPGLILEQEEPDLFFAEVERWKSR
jgi:siroheme synthase-like protein